MNELTSAMSILKSTSVHKELELLRKLVQEPKSVDKLLYEAVSPALSSQGRFAAFEYLEYGIVKMSLNTQKGIANKLIIGGYEVLNDYRRAALDKLQEMERRETFQGRGTISWYKRELNKKIFKLLRL